MGKIVKITKNIYGKINWNIIKDLLSKLKSKVVVIKESNSKVKFDKKFIKEFVSSKYTQSANRKIKNIKANLVYNIIDIIENACHLNKEKNCKDKHNCDANLGWEKYKCRFDFEGRDELGNKVNVIYSCVIVVRCPNFNEKYIYDIVEIKKEINQSQR